MDKALAGGMSEYTGDSGVSKDQVNSLLTYIEDNGHLGVLLAGIAGTGKTQLAKAVGQASGKPVIVFDLGAMKGGIVGQSERLIRAALKVVTATAEGRVLFIGTANRTAIFTPEMNRRFPDQFFYDVPDDLGRAAIWPVYIQKNGLRASQARIPQGFDAGWTGAEIRRACEKAAMFGKTVVEAAQFIVPTVVSQAPIIEQMRRDAAGRFLSASYSGFYQLPEIEVPAEGTRAIDVN
jgi:SpoVK/Ycf46/Vps4 family AAA+-type ATPase